MSTLNKTQTGLFFLYLLRGCWCNAQSYLGCYRTINSKFIAMPTVNPSLKVSSLCIIYNSVYQYCSQSERCSLFEISRAWCSLPLSLRLVSSSPQWFQTPEWDVHNPRIVKPRGLQWCGFCWQWWMQPSGRLTWLAKLHYIRQFFFGPFQCKCCNEMRRMSWESSCLRNTRWQWQPQHTVCCLDRFIQ